MNNFKKKIVIFSDIDGTLIDHEDYSSDESIKTLRKLISLKIPVILVSSKSSAEIELYRQRMRLADPFISENGGAVFIPEDYFKKAPEGCLRKGQYLVKELASPLSQLSGKIKKFKDSLNDDILLYTDWSPEKIRNISHLSLEEARLSKKREYDLPFLIQGSSRLKDKDLFCAAERCHLSITKGERYYHIISGSHKGKAVQYLKKEFNKEFRNFISVGAGDGPNDLQMLLEVDEPIAIKRPDGTYAPELLKEVPSLIKTEQVGPAGWSEAISQILRRYNIL